MMASARITIRGLVQGVGFRYFTQKRALALNLTGFVRNERNGDVYVEVEGRKDIIEDFVKQIEKGPAFSRVRSTEVEWTECMNKFTDFRTTE